jgi:DNA polymerase III psi subunit
MDSSPALHWLGIDQWVLRVPMPGHLSGSVALLETDTAPSDAPVAEQQVALVDSPEVAHTEGFVGEPNQNAGLCFIAANSAEFSALVSAISRCLPPGKPVMHQSASDEQPPSVYWNGQTWSLAELRRSGQAKRALWRWLVGSKA